jgi:CRISPR type III-A-associated RAMP protein Csm5
MLLRLYTLSPLHIGTGEELAPLDYLAFEDKFYRLSQKQLFELIKQHFGGNQGLKDFSSWISEQYTWLANTQDNKKQSEIASDINAYNFFKSKNKEKVLIAYLRDNPHLGSKLLLNEAQTKTNKSNFHKLGQVREAVRTAGNHFVPGSTIKGSIRTALLYHFMSSFMQFEYIEKIIEDQLNSRRRVPPKAFAKSLENNVFFCDYFDALKGINRSGEAQMDLLRALHVSDARPLPGGKTLEIAKIDLYLVQKNKKKKDEAVLEASKQEQTLYAEVIPAGVEFQFKLQIDGMFLKLLADKMSGKGSVQVGDYEYWLNLENRLKGIFGLEVSEMRQLSAQEIEKRALEHVVKATKNFVDKQLQYHQQWLNNFKSFDEAKLYTEKVDKGIEPITSCNKTMLHFGNGAGFTATTALLYFLEDEKRKMLAKYYLEELGIGKAPKKKKLPDENSDKPFFVVINRFPKSKKLVETTNFIQPMGWVALLDEEDKELPSLAAITEVNVEDIPTKSILEEQNVGFSYFKGTINPKKPPVLDAEVIESGTPNKVKVYITPEYTPITTLLSYRTPLTVGVVVEVTSQFNNKKELTSAVFKKIK